jgi:hypothetical protein
MRRSIHPNRWFLLLIAVISLGSAYSQCQPDTTIKQSGYYPDQLDTCFIEEDYEFTLQILALKDTQVVFAGQNVTAQIDSIHITDVIGLPSGFQYACNPARCVYSWRKVGCAKLTGKANAAQIGSYPLKFAFVAYARAFGIRQEVNDTIRDFTLVIADPATVGVPQLQSSNMAIYPNPTTGVVQLKNVSNGTLIRVYSISGQQVLEDRVENEQIDLSPLKPGWYFLKTVENGKLRSGKVIVLPR